MGLHRFARLMDALTRGVSPPGLIDMVHVPHSHLRRRFTMIARYDGKRGRWSATGLVLSLLLGGVALTGAVSGQDASPSGPARPAAPAAKPDQPAEPAQPAAASAGKEGKPSVPPGYANLTEPEVEKKLWDEKYAPRIFFVEGREANREQVDQEYLAELKHLKDTMRAAGAFAPAPGRKGGVEDEDVDRAVLAQLDRKVPELSFGGAPLEEVIDFLRDVSDANIVVNWDALEAGGVPRDAPVSLRVRNVTVAHALELILSAAGGHRVPLAYTIDRNVIRISTGEDLDRIVDVRAYDVRDVVPAEMPMADLAKLIQDAVDPDSWREAGGSVGAVHTSKHKLIVTQTPMNHRQIRSVLQMLREEPRPVTATDAASAAHATPSSPAQPAPR